MDKHFIYLALEKCDGNLTDYITNHGRSLLQRERVDLLQQVTQGVKYLHEQQIGKLNFYTYILIFPFIYTLLLFS